MAALPIVGIHLDLKYTMPRKDYLHDWLRRLPAFGVNAVFLEYEDKFPFAKYPFIQAEGAFTPDELRAFLALGRRLGLRMIPLVQTLSHLEFALDHDELAALRERPDIPTQINPLNPDAVQFVKDLITEVIVFHADEPLFHIGADEAWHLGLGQTPPLSTPEQKLELWGRHTTEVCRFVLAAGKRPVVWDDIFRDCPERVTVLPKEAVLNSWSYGSRHIEPDKFPWRNVDVYQAEGHEVLGSPCLNAGVFFPPGDRAANTACWARKIHQAGLLGMHNTSWACFHIPLAMQWLQVAATGALMDDPDLEITRAWQADFYEQEFGVRVDGLPEALDGLSVVWEQRVEGLGRPITPVVYGYMDMVLHYPGGQTERRARGAYPVDWAKIDFTAMYRRKIELLRGVPDQAAVGVRIGELLRTYGDARGPIHQLADAATSHEADLMAAFVDRAWTGARTVSHLLRGDDDRDQLLDELAAQQTRLRDALAPFLEPVSIDRMMRLWWQAEYDTLCTQG